MGVTNFVFINVWQRINECSQQYQGNKTVFQVGIRLRGDGMLTQCICLYLILSHRLLIFSSVTCSDDNKDYCRPTWTRNMASNWSLEGRLFPLEQWYKIFPSKKSVYTFLLLLRTTVSEQLF